MFAPGHTPGCLNFCFDVHDHGELHHAVMMGGFGIFGPGRPDFEEKKGQMLVNLFGSNASVAETKYAELTCGEPREKWTKVLSDMMYRSYTDALAARLCELRVPLWVCSFEYLPAVHGMGFSFLMGECGRHAAAHTAEELARQKRVSEEMRRAVRRFICTGVPADSEVWPEYRGNRKMVFDRCSHMEERRGDSLTDLPAMVYQRR